MSAARRSSALWSVAKAMMLVSLVPLATAVWFLVVGVTNPGVQDCGSPAAFVVTGRENQRPDLVGKEITPGLRALDRQPRCASLVQDRLVLAAWTGGFGLLLALSGSVVGLVDDRRALRAEPPFESYLRDDGLPA